ncbi:MAG: hypothetical protein AB1630_10410 [bacterium]
MNKYKEIINKISKEDLQKGTEFFERDMFWTNPKEAWFFEPIMIFLIFLIILKQGAYVWICVILHLLSCVLIAFWLGRIHIESKLIFFLKHIENYLPFEDLLKDGWLFVQIRYMLKKGWIYWTSAIISLKFFILYSIPVFLPIVVFYNESVKIIRQTEGYFILYPILLFSTTYYFFSLLGFLFWKKLKKELLEIKGQNE